MIIYSVTVAIPRSLSQEWKTWMLETHIPEVMHTGCFEDFTMSRLLEPEMEGEDETFNIQYFAPTFKTLELYRTMFAPKLQQAYKDKYGGQMTIFRSVLEKIR